MSSRAMFSRLVTVVRIMLGVEFVVNGLNWWVKLIGPYPSISDFAHRAPHPGFVGAMIATGFMFHIVKATELLAGLVLLSNRFVPLALVLAFPVTVNVFLVDVFMNAHLRGMIMGTGALAMNGFLMLACLQHYAPMLASRTELVDPVIAPRWLKVADTPLFTNVVMLLGVVAAAFGIVMLSWVGAMIVQHFAS